MKLDSNALIYLTKIDIIEIIAKFYSPINITRTIYQEVVVVGKIKGYSDAFIIDSYISKGKILIKPDEANHPENLSSLSKGEITAINEVIHSNEMIKKQGQKQRNLV